MINMFISNDMSFIYFYALPRACYGSIQYGFILIMVECSLAIFPVPLGVGKMALYRKNIDLYKVLWIFWAVGP